MTDDAREIYRVFPFGRNAIEEAVARIRAEAAEEARKEAADIAVEWVNKNLCDEHMPIMFKRMEEDELRAAILKGAVK